MTTMTVTHLARNLSRVMDRLEHGGEEVLVVRNRTPIARILPGAPEMRAGEAFADLEGVLAPEDGEAWLEDMARADAEIREGVRDPWA